MKLRTKQLIAGGIAAVALVAGLAIGGASQAAVVAPVFSCSSTLATGTDAGTVTMRCTVPNKTKTVTKTVTPSPSPTSTSSSTSSSPSPSPTSTSPSSSPSSSPSPSPTSTPPSLWQCVTSDPSGRCGTAWSSTSYCDYPDITGIRGGTNGGCAYVDQDEWGPITGEKQTLSANSPGDWKVVNSTPTNPSGSVTTYPNVGAPYDEQPLSSFTSVIGSFDETMPHNSATSAWAAYDNWFDDWGYEVMIQHDFTNNGPCDFVHMATFGGSNGVPVQLWGLCTYGSELIWKLAAPGSHVGDSGTMNESSGSVDIKAMVNDLVSSGYMTANPTITNLSYGWEICSTGGASETFEVNSYSLKAS